MTSSLLGLLTRVEMFSPLTRFYLKILCQHCVGLLVCAWLRSREMTLRFEIGVYSDIAYTDSPDI